MHPMRRSKALAEAGYDPERQVLRLRFRHQGLYDYYAVPPEVLTGLLVSEHPWTEWQDHIKSHYRFDRLE